MLLYRATKTPYLENYTGRGSSFLNGARWNQKGDPVLYFAPSPSIAQLEMANYILSPRLIPKGMVMGVYEIPDSVSSKTLTINDMPGDWKDYPYPVSTQSIGSQWLNNQLELCLYVPSTAVTGGRENIMVLNPLHTAIVQLKLVDTITELYNIRAFQGVD